MQSYSEGSLLFPFYIFLFCKWNNFVSKQGKRSTDQQLSTSERTPWSWFPTLQNAQSKLTSETAWHWAFYKTFKHHLPLEEPQKCCRPHSYQELFPVVGPLCPCTAPLQAMEVTTADKLKFLISGQEQGLQGVCQDQVLAPNPQFSINFQATVWGGIGLLASSTMRLSGLILCWGREGGRVNLFNEMLEAHLMKILIYVIFCEKSSM